MFFVRALIGFTPSSRRRAYYRTLYPAFTFVLVFMASSFRFWVMQTTGQAVGHSQTDSLSRRKLLKRNSADFLGFECKPPAINPANPTVNLDGPD